ncbi:ABC transporter permease [Mycoplasma procyoni]|uniref:ABC transporter permease n=1 Tax=Mycoplasma procyoni TaxID=568784 RepID=UPI00197BAF50|nr:ABC transporter permease [Mycoplasma procyoni]MBN3534852.1 ABC transporter permease [Mycoplasma procyoni]
MAAFLSILLLAVTFFCIVSLASLSGLFSEKSGIVNIGIEGMMIVGATVYGMLSHILKISNAWMQIPLLIASGLITGLFAMLHGFVTIKLKGDHIISGVAINLLAPALSIFLLKLVGDANKFNSNVKELAASVNTINDPLNIISLKVVVVIVIFVVAIVMLRYTKWGIRFKAIGENPQAADVAGINVNFFKWQGVVISGMIAGVAGGIFFQWRGGSFAGTAEGIGFLALTILIMGQWKPAFVFIFASLFAVIYSTAANFSIGQGVFKDFAAYGYLFNTIPFVATLLILMFTSKKSLAPAALGQPYDKSKR